MVTEPSSASGASDVWLSSTQSPALVRDEVPLLVQQLAAGGVDHLGGTAVAIDFDVIAKAISDCWGTTKTEASASRSVLAILSPPASFAQVGLVVDEVAGARQNRPGWCSYQLKRRGSAAYSAPAILGTEESAGIGVASEVTAGGAVARKQVAAAGANAAPPFKARKSGNQPRRNGEAMMEPIA